MWYWRHKQNIFNSRDVDGRLVIFVSKEGSQIMSKDVHLPRKASNIRLVNDIKIRFFFVPEHYSQALRYSLSWWILKINPSIIDYATENMNI